MNNHSIRPLNQQDLARVCQIEQLAYSIPWSDSLHQSCLDSNYPSLVLEFEEQIEGYCIFNYLYDECHLMNIAVNPKLQGHGLAQELMKAMYLACKERGMVKTILEVRAGNQRAIDFYLQQGFEQIGLRKRYYKNENGREDAIVMEKPL
ncbi:MAG: ribosomal protein S18-alanine N-acetyltransferase [Kangiellaceae bacterium]|nr:ribosomal protein S18-alanine N-acetyltransferase [Kangiellaceae bacterium]